MRRDKIDLAKRRREKTILLRERERERSVYVMMKREKKKSILSGYKLVSVGVEPYLSRIIYKNGIITQFTSPKNFKKLFSFSTTLT